MIGVVVVLLVSLFWGEWVNMSIGMLVYEVSILVVILNVMRFLRFKIKINWFKLRFIKIFEYIIEV